MPTRLTARRTPSAHPDRAYRAAGLAAAALSGSLVTSSLIVLWRFL